MDKKLLNIYGISNSHSQSGAFALILTDTETQKRIPIIIGAFEAQAIAMSLEGVKPSRPLTHDLFKSFADIYKVRLNEIFINDFKEGVFYSLLICSNQDGEIVKIDSRTSDAIALAVRFGCPIYASPEVVEKTAIIMETSSESDIEDENEEDDVKPMKSSGGSLSNYSDEDLQKILDKAITEENFEYAAKLHQEIKKRSEKKE